MVVKGVERCELRDKQTYRAMHEAGRGQDGIRVGRPCVLEEGSRKLLVVGGCCDMVTTGECVREKLDQGEATGVADEEITMEFGYVKA